MVLAGPNGAGKTTLYERVLARHITLEFVNADRIAQERWPGHELEHGYDAARLAAERRAQLLDARESFLTETVFSHESKLHLMRDAAARGYLVSLHVIVIPEALAVARVANRVETGGHDVPEDKVRARYRRLWGHVREAIAIADETTVYDNSSARTPLRPIAHYRLGEPIGIITWPDWVPTDLGRRPAD